LEWPKCIQQKKTIANKRNEHSGKEVCENKDLVVNLVLEPGNMGTKKENIKKLKAFELWVWRTMESISWT